MRKTVRTAVPGVAVMVIKDGRVKYKKGSGVADLSTGASITPDTPFYIASLGKQFTAVAVMMLAERGRLSYDDKLTKYFPEFESFASNIVIRQLLTHTSGSGNLKVVLYAPVLARPQVGDSFDSLHTL